jgi:hypothetical protein
MIDTTKAGGKFFRPNSAARFGFGAASLVAAGCMLATVAFAADQGGNAPNPPVSRQSASQQGRTVGPIYYPPENQDITGVWQTQHYYADIEEVLGHPVPFNDAGMQKWEENKMAIASGDLTDEARRVCVPDGLPRILSNPYPFQIIETPGQITLIYELNHVIRPIKLDVEQADADTLEIFPYYMGHSVGHWDGDTMVIESAGFNEKTWLDATGKPSSWQKTTVERIRKVDANTLEDQITITDPMYLTEPFTVTYRYDKRDNLRLEDYNCGDQHRDISNIPGVQPRN